jgi:hypothetical protein
MRYNYEVRWYEWNLTKQKSRKFFTEMGASFFAWYKEFFFGAVTKIYEI